MKNVYEVLEISIVSFAEDIVTSSTVNGNFGGDPHGFTNPNSGPANFSEG
jgi:hypothetical protein